MKKLFAGILAGAVAAVGWTGSAFAWGNDGHQTVAAIAYPLLTAEAKKRVNAILGDETGTGAAFIAASTWPDDIRGLKENRPYPESGPWHYVTITLANAAYVPNRDCKTGDCVVEKINAVNKQVTDTALLPAIRRDALSFLIHFVGDVHQPLHAAENGGLRDGTWVGDRGGNEVKVILNGRETNLHSVWDSGIIKASWGNVEAHRKALITVAPEKIFKWAAGTPADWATESHRIAVRFVYPSLGQTPAQPGPVVPAVVLPPDYAVKMRPIVDAQIVKAGIRLATLLNQDFGQP